MGLFLLCTAISGGGFGLGFFFLFFLMSPLSAFEDINKTSIIHRSTSSTCCEWIVTLGGLNNMWNNQSLRYSCLGGSLFPPQKQKFQGIILRFRVIFSENLKSKLWFNNLKVWLTDVEKYIFFLFGLVFSGWNKLPRVCICACHPCQRQQSHKTHTQNVVLAQWNFVVLKWI